MMVSSRLLFIYIALAGVKIEKVLLLSWFRLDGILRAGLRPWCNDTVEPDVGVAFRWLWRFVVVVLVCTSSRLRGRGTWNYDALIRNVSEVLGITSRCWVSSVFVSWCLNNDRREMIEFGDELIFRNGFISSAGAKCTSRFGESIVGVGSFLWIIWNRWRNGRVGKSRTIF